MTTNEQTAPHRMYRFVDTSLHTFQVYTSNACIDTDDDFLKLEKIPDKPCWVETTDVYFFKPRPIVRKVVLVSRVYMSFEQFYKEYTLIKPVQLPPLVLKKHGFVIIPGEPIVPK